MPSKSKKQARLMAAVAHNPKFAKKVGIPQSVGREFNDADRRRGFADGGKVKAASRISKLLKSSPQFALHRWEQGQGDWSQNVRFYDEILENEQWDPDISEKDLALMLDYSTGLYPEFGPKQIQRLDELIKQHGIRPRRYNTWRGLELDPEYVSNLRPGDKLVQGPHSSVSVSKDTADAFAHQGAYDANRVPTLLRVAPNERLALPIPFSGQSELLMPAGEAGRMWVDKVKRDSGNVRLDVEVLGPHPGFSEGGEVLPSSTEEDEEWSDTYLKRPLSGLASMWGATDPETGELVNPVIHNLKRVWNADERRRQGLPRQEMATMGLVDETVSLPALGGIVGLPVPEFASRAEDRASNTREATRRALGLDAPHGFVENIAESAGVMAGQLPVPASVANKLKLLKNSGKLGKAGKVLGPAAEWFSPTVVPKASNYIKGTLFGGTLGGALDYLGDYVDEKEEKERHKQFISEAMAEVLEEERLEAAEASGSEETDDEALAELGYAEGGKVSAARRALQSLRDVEDVEDKAVRQAAIDQALRAISAPGTVELPKTIRAGLNEQRTPSGVSSLVERALPLLKPARESNVPPIEQIPSDLPPPARVISADEAESARGTMADEEFERRLRRLGYHDRGANKPLAREMQQHEQDDQDWDGMFGYAEGGEVGTNKRNPLIPIPAPQAQKEEMAAQQAGQQPAAARPGAPLSQEWFENYGAGPEHLFMGDRTIKLHDMWGPQHPGAVPPVQQNPEGSWLPGVGIVGLALYDEWKKKRGEQAGADTSQQAFWNDMHASAANTADTDAWVAQQLDQYGTNAPMPVMGEDGSISYVEPNKFWSDMHASASNTADTDAWVNSQLENYNAPMPVMNDDGSISYVNAQGEPVESGGLNLGRAWQGVGGAYDMYSGLQAGDAQGYIQALQGANDLYGAYTGTSGFGGAAGTGVGALSGLASIYGGIQEGGVRGYTQAAGGVAQTAQSLGYNNGAVGALGTAASVVGALYSAYGAYESAKVGDKKGAVAQGAAAGAAIGSVIPVIGTAVGAVVGAVVGLIGASLGNKQQASEAYYGAHKKLKPDEVIRGWGEDQVNGAVFETIKSHTKSGNINKFQDVGEMYTAFGITKDAHKNYKNVQSQMGEFIKGVVQTAQQMGSLPTDPMELKQLDGQQIYYKVVVPALAAKFKEQTGKESQAWTTDKIKPGQGSQLHELMADWTDWMTSHMGEAEAKQQQLAQLQASRASTPGGAGLGMTRVGGGRVLERARGGRVTSFEDNPRQGALAVLH